MIFLLVSCCYRPKTYVKTNNPTINNSEVFPGTSLHATGPYQLCYDRTHYYKLFGTVYSVECFNTQVWKMSLSYLC